MFQLASLPGKLAIMIVIYGLLRSSLIMGVHPGCPVCSIVAASLVAVEIIVGETISAAKVAFVCSLWSVRVVALLSACPSSCFCIHQLLFLCLEVLVQGASPHHAVGCKVIMIIIINALKGAIQDFYNLLTAPRTVSNTYTQMASAQSCANIQHASCATYGGDNSAVKFGKVEIAFILPLFSWLKLFTDDFEFLLRTSQSSV